jgi:SNF2 family DNA or RNA helicase
MLNRALELWPLLHLCDPERFSHPQSYIDRFCGESGRLSCHPDELRETLKPYLLRRLKSLLNLPEQSEERLTVRPSTRPPHDARQILEELRDAHRGGDGIPARAMKALAEVRQWVATEKAKQAIPWIEEHVSTSDPIVVFFTHKATHDILKRGLKALTLYDPSLQTERPLRVASIVGKTPKKKRQAYKEAFEAGQIDVILGSEAARDGITLVRARLSLHVERWYTPEAESQAKGRIHRIGQTRDVTNVTMHLEDGYDDWIDGLVTAKSKTIRRVIDG